MFNNENLPKINCKDITLNKAQKDRLSDEIKKTCSRTVTTNGFGDGSIIYDLNNPDSSATLSSGGNVVRYYELSSSTGTPVTIDGQQLFYTEKYLKVVESNQFGDVTSLGNGEYEFGKVGSTVLSSGAKFSYVETNSSGTTTGNPVVLDLTLSLRNVNAGWYSNGDYFGEKWDFGITGGSITNGALSKQGQDATHEPQLLNHTQGQSTLTGSNIDIDTTGSFTSYINGNPNLTYLGTGTGSAITVTYTRTGVASKPADALYQQFGEVNVVSILKPVKTPQTECVEWTIKKCEQEIDVIEYESNCNSADCNYKEVQKTKLYRNGYEKNDGSYLWTDWVFRDRNLKDLKDTYDFDGNILVNLQTDFPWIVEGSYRVSLNTVKVYLFSDCCSTCGNSCKKQDGYKYELVVPKKFVPKNCFDKEPAKIYATCLKTERPHWKVTCNETYSNLCNWSSSTSGCQVFYNYLNKQQFRDWLVENTIKNIGNLETFLKTHQFSSLNNCGVGSILKTSNKTIFGAIDELKNEFNGKQNKNINLTRLSSIEISKLQKL